VLQEKNKLEFWDSVGFAGIFVRIKFLGREKKTWRACEDPRDLQLSASSLVCCIPPLPLLPLLSPSPLGSLCAGIPVLLLTTTTPVECRGASWLGTCRVFPQSCRPGEVGELSRALCVTLHCVRQCR
jgi:hypothetical protein